MSRPPSLYSQDDPISVAMRPPASESDTERRSRLEQEKEARRISDQIDEEIRLERERLRKSKNDVRLLLLGQAESGKSTLQKQFQLMYKPNSLEKERSSWRTVIYFNVVRSLKHILTTLESWGDSFDEADSEHDETMNDTTPSTSVALQDRSSADSLSSNEDPSRSVVHPQQPSNQPRPTTPRDSKDSLRYQIANLRRRLSPLVASDAQLADRLTDGVTVSGSGKGEVFVRSGWQARTIQYGLGAAKRAHMRYTADTRTSVDSARGDSLVEDVGKMLESLKQDILELWMHPTVQKFIAKRRLRLDEWEEFFLWDINRIASSGYLPTTDDILHARIQTMGVSEHVFDVDLHGSRVTWHLYDVGGARGQRHSWVPYFDDANAIIFLAPISAFDQYLDEDPRTNRIDDSLQLFTQICSNTLLSSVHLVLFLNKADLLKSKLASGIKVKRYITSYGERENDFENVAQYFRAHFVQAHKRNNDHQRVLYTHLTSVVDTQTTRRIMTNVRDSIFRDYLQSAALV